MSQSKCENKMLIMHKRFVWLEFFNNLIEAAMYDAAQMNSERRTLLMRMSISKTAFNLFTATIGIQSFNCVLPASNAEFKCFVVMKRRPLFL